MLAVLITTACTRGANSAATPTPTPRSPGQVAWTSCGSGFQCGIVTVPLDYSHPSAGTIDIAVNRKPATDPAKRIGSVLINPGGPGASGVTFLRGEAANMKVLNQRFDLVGFDPRGVGLSAPVRCLDGPQEDAFNAIDSVLDDPQEKQAFIQADKDYTAACQQRNANILPFVDTVSAAKDLDLIRAAVGDTKLTYFGFSYGTFLGETYAHLFPSHVRALALDGVLDPALSLDQINLSQVVSFERNLQAFMADCIARRAASTPCRYAQSGDPNTKLVALMRRLDSVPIPVGKRQLTRSLAMYGVLLSMYDQSFWPYLDQALTLADRGNGAVLLALSDFYFSRHANGTYDNEFDANWAINCLDHPVLNSVADYDRLGPAFAQASALFGPWSQFDNLACTDWPVRPTGHPGPLTAPGAPPILLIGGTNDPATPYAWAESVNQQLAGSVLLTRQGNGHTSYDVSVCSHAATDVYLIDLTLPAEGTVCSS
jgi:pimeloyl-ACP methyl ester carboxylesterase